MPVLDAIAAASNAEVVVIATPDAAIEPVCRMLSSAGRSTTATAVVHASGATGLDALGAAAALGAATLSVHPLQTCPTVEAASSGSPARPSPSRRSTTPATTSANGSPVTPAAARSGSPTSLKPLYHAAAVFASNYLVTVTAIAEELERSAGLDDPLGALAPLQEATLANVERVGPAAALTGPAVRGDAVTVRRTWRRSRIAPEAVRPYVASPTSRSARGALGRLPADGREAVEEELARWR